MGFEQYLPIEEENYGIKQEWDWVKKEALLSQNQAEETWAVVQETEKYLASLETSLALSKEDIDGMYWFHTLDHEPVSFDV